MPRLFSLNPEQLSSIWPRAPHDRRIAWRDRCSSQHPRGEQRLQIDRALPVAQQGMLITLDHIGLAIGRFGEAEQLRRAGQADQHGGVGGAEDLGVVDR